MIDYEKPILDKRGNPLKIWMIGKHHCIRCVKKARALMKRGYEVHGMGDKVVYGTEDYKTYHIWKNEQQFKEEIKLAINSGTSILEWNNEPDAPAKWIREVIDDMGKQNEVKLVSDLHDIDSVRRKEGIIPIPERELFNSSDGLMYVSLPTQRISNKLHTVTKPNIVLHAYCNEGIIEYDESKIPERRDAMVYEGGVNPIDNQEINMIYPYRNLFPIMRQLIAQGNEVHAFVGNSDAYMSGQNTGVILYPPTKYDKMMKELIKFKWGLLIFNNKGNTEPQVTNTMTNKMFEYSVCGLPSIAGWCAESERYVNHWKIGMTFDSIEDIGDGSKLDEKYPELMENLKNFNNKVFMENFIVRSENLYAHLLGVEKKGLPDRILNLHRFEYGKEEAEKVLYDF